MSYFPLPGLYILLPLLCLGGVLAGYWLGGRRKEDPYRALAALDPASLDSAPVPVPPPPESWAQKNTDKLLIASLLSFNMLVTLYVVGTKDAGQIQFFNGLTNLLSGGLLTLVTGAALRKTTDTTITKDPDTGRTMGITTVRDEEK